MKLLCHRGIWTEAHQKNTHAALCAAFDQRLGIETDIRDCNGKLVVSHDMPRAETAGDLDALLSHYQDLQSSAPLALNVKADGLQQALLHKLQSYQVKNYFVFDMSVPDTLGYRRLNMPFAARLSEYESPGVLLDQASHVWLDAFDSEWYSMDVIEGLLAQGKHVAVVSPELHRRAHQDLWAALRRWDLADRLYLCTDLVASAMEVFHVHQD